MDNGAIGWPVVTIGIGLAGVFITLAAFILNSMRDIQANMRMLLERQDKLAERLGRVEQEQARMNGVLETLPERLEGVEEGQDKLAERLGRQEQEQARMNGVLETLPERLGRLEQEQARMNGMLETMRAGFSYRLERADAGDRVAEASESYESQE